MEARVSLHPHQAYSVLACRLLFLPATSRDALEPCVCQSASACTAIVFFFLKKGKLLSQRNREGFTELCNRKTRAHARTQHTQRTHTRTHARTHTSHGEAGKGGRVSLRSAPFASGRAVGTRVVCKGVTGRGGRRPVQCVCVWCVCVCVSINKFLAAAFLHSLPFVHHITQKQITSTLGEKSKKRKVSRWSTVDR